MLLDDRTTKAALRQCPCFSRPGNVELGGDRVLSGASQCQTPDLHCIKGTCCNFRVSRAPVTGPNTQKGLEH